MNLIVELEDVWAASIADKPGGLAEKLALLAEAGADLDFLIARRVPAKPGTGVVFVTPLRNDQEMRAATAAGFSVSQSLHSVRVEGANEPGIGARLTRRLGEAGLNLRGMSGAVVGTRFILHFAFDSAEDSKQAIVLLRKQS